MIPEWSNEETRVFYQALIDTPFLYNMAYTIYRVYGDDAAEALRDWAENIVWWHLPIDHELLKQMGETGALANVNWNDILKVLRSATP